MNTIITDEGIPFTITEAGAVILRMTTAGGTVTVRTTIRGEAAQAAMPAVLRMITGDVRPQPDDSSTEAEDAKLF